MTIEQLQNVTYRAIGNPVAAYRITANEGYCIHLVTHAENEYAYNVAVPASYDLSTIQVLLIAELPEGAEIHGGNDNNTEIM